MNNPQLRMLAITTCSACDYHYSRDKKDTDLCKHSQTYNKEIQKEDGQRIWIPEWCKLPKPSEVE